MPERSDDAQTLRGFAFALAATVTSLGAARLLAPRVHPSADASALIVFLGAALVGVVGPAIGVRAKIAGKIALVAIAVAAALLASLYVSRSSTSGAAIAVDAGLVVLAIALGGAIGTHVEDPGHLLPAGFIAAAADVLSVTSESGPTHAIANNARALSLLALSFPVPGTTAFAPALGLGDLVFVALIFGVVRVHALPYVRTVACALVGVLIAGFGSALLEAAVPALPAIAGAVLLGVPRTRQVRPKDRGLARAACIASALFIVVQLVRLRLHR